MLPAMARLLSPIFADHLPGGRWDKLKGLPSHNKYSESIFGHVDHLMREKPCITTIASESYIMFTHNHTLEWLKQKDSSERAQLLHHAKAEIQNSTGRNLSKKADSNCWENSPWARSTSQEIAEEREGDRICDPLGIVANWEASRCNAAKWKHWRLSWTSGKTSWNRSLWIRHRRTSVLSLPQQEVAENCLLSPTWHAI